MPINDTAMSAYGYKRKCLRQRKMSAIQRKADINRALSLCPLLTQSRPKSLVPMIPGRTPLPPLDLSPRQDERGQADGDQAQRPESIQIEPTAGDEC